MFSSYNELPKVTAFVVSEKFVSYEDLQKESYTRRSMFIDAASKGVSELLTRNYATIRSTLLVCLVGRSIGIKEDDSDLAKGTYRVGTLVYARRVYVAFKYLCQAGGRQKLESRFSEKRRS